MMTTLDFAPLYRSSVGFDHLFDLLESAGRAPAAENWPSYDIVKLDEDSYRITMAVAGFSEDDLTVTQEPNLLVVRGSTKGSADANYLHRGIAGRKRSTRNHYRQGSQNVTLRRFGCIVGKRTPCCGSHPITQLRHRRTGIDSLPITN